MDCSFSNALYDCCAIFPCTQRKAADPDDLRNSSSPFSMLGNLQVLGLLLGLQHFLEKLMMGLPYLLYPQGKHLGASAFG